jgi:alpha-L-rhamnosidase
MKTKENTLMKTTPTLLTALLLALCGFTFAAHAATPVNLRCEYMKNPLGVDAPKPALSWEIASADPAARGVKQTAYQIQAASSPELLADGKSDLWDTGKVKSDQTLLVEYAGKPLASSQRVYWKVRVFDESGKMTDSSEPTFFHTGIIKPKDWKAQWIAEPDAAKQQSKNFRDWKRTFAYPGSTFPISRVPAGAAAEHWVNSNLVARTHSLKRFKKDATEAENRLWCSERREEALSATRFRKEFEVAGKPARAMLFVSGLGSCRLWINGQAVHDRILDPAETDFNRRVLYTAFDVTGLLKPGKNALCAEVSEGWFGNDMTYSEPNTQYRYGDRPVLLAQLEVASTDGKSTTVATGPDWQCSVDGPVIKNNVFGGEVYDARREIPGWDHAGYNAGGWHPVVAVAAPAPRVESQVMPPIRVVKTIKTAKLSQPKPGVWVFDMGTLLSGHARIKVNAPAGTMLTLRFGETLNENGTVSQPQSLNSGGPYSHVYVCKGGGEEVWEPSGGTYIGFRHVQIEGLPGEAKPEMAEGRACRQDLERVGAFECSNDLFNKIYDACVRSVAFSQHGKPASDCTREKTAFLAEAYYNVFLRTMTFEDAAYISKFVRDMNTTAVNKAIPGFGPVYMNISPGPRAGVGWDDYKMYAIIQQWDHYLFHGDKRLLEESYPTMKATVEFMRDATKAYSGLCKNNVMGDLNGPTFQDGLDWNVYRSPDNNTFATATAYYWLGTDRLAKTATLLGNADDAKKYTQLAKEISTAYHNAIYDPNKGSFGSQTDDMIALSTGICDPNKRVRVGKDLKLRMKIWKDHVASGTQVFRLFGALCDSGNENEAFLAMNQTDYPSLGMMTKFGDAMWEGYGGWILNRTPKGASEPVGAGWPMLMMAQSGAGRWFPEYVAGIQLDPGQPGFKHFILRPFCVNQLDWAKGSYRSVRGLIESDWKKENGKLVWNVTVPPNTTATAYIPSSSAEDVTESGKSLAKSEGVKFTKIENGRALCELQSGAYRFECKLEEKKQQ